jgi:hypothetical protein
MRGFAQKHCTIAVAGRKDFRRAAKLASDDALRVRAGDALHLAINENLSTRVILCLDQAIIESARLLRMNVARL